MLHEMFRQVKNIRDLRHMQKTDALGDHFFKHTHSVFSFETIFISDIHLGSRKTASPYLYEFLTHLDLDRLKEIYIVGDFIGGWEMMSMKQQKFPEIERRILDVLNYASTQGIKINIIPGNHDEKLRPLLPQLQNRRDKTTFNDNYHFAHEMFYTAEIDKTETNAPHTETGPQIDTDHTSETGADKNTAQDTKQNIKLKIVHGDEYEPSLFMKPWFRPVTYAVSEAYDMMVKVNYHASNFLYKHFGIHISLAKRLKNGFKSAIDYFFSHDSLAAGLDGTEYDGVIMGHTHMAGIKTFVNDKSNETSWLINDGDWVESATFAAVREGNGLPEIFDYKKEREKCGFGELTDEEDHHPAHFMAMRPITNRQVRHIQRLWPARNKDKHLQRLQHARTKITQHNNDKHGLSAIMTELHNTASLSAQARKTLTEIFERTKEHSYKTQKEGLKRIFNQYAADETIDNDNDLLFVKTVVREFGQRCERKIRKHEARIQTTMDKLDITQRQPIVPS